jgi:hypothetical protein
MNDFLTDQFFHRISDRLTRTRDRINRRVRSSPIYWLFVALCIPFDFYFGAYKTKPVPWSPPMLKVFFSAALSAPILAALYSAVLALWFRLRRLFP